MTTILSVKDVSRSFGALRALDSVSFDVRQGQIKAVIGPNGAGKSSLFNVISGFDIADSGSVFYNGTALGSTPSHLRVRRGMARTFQNTRLFDELSVRENVMVALASDKLGRRRLSAPRSGESRGRTTHTAAEADRLLRFTGLAESADVLAGELSTGSRRLLEIARALGTRPELLLLDEPAAGLNGAETAHLASILFRIRDEGVTILIVEHDMGLVMSVSDEIVVLDRGRKIAEGPPLLIQKDTATIAAYLGTDPEEVEL